MTKKSLKNSYKATHIDLYSDYGPENESWKNNLAVSSRGGNKSENSGKDNSGKFWRLKEKRMLVYRE